MNFKQIAKKLRIPPETVRRTVLQFEQRGHDFGRLGLHRPRFKHFTPRIKRHLLSKSLLEHWAPYSIAERAEIISRVWGEQISRSQLQRFYQHHKVSFLTAKVRFRYA